MKQAMKTITRGAAGLAMAAFAASGAWAQSSSGQDGVAESFIRSGEAAIGSDFERDRQAILGMTGDYRVRFDFTETLAIDPDYELQDRHTSGGTEMVRVLEDTGDFISLQHTLVMDHGGTIVVVKHWRQDWAYEPQSVLQYQGGNLWIAEPAPAEDRSGAWSQSVYQVDDSPRYAALARWRHAPEASTWEPPVSWRPLPRRDGVTRTDYDVIAGVNRHTVAPHVWWHEQDNSKLALENGAPREIVREVGVNTYRPSDEVSMQAGEEYWEKTGPLWAVVREEWRRAEATGRLSVNDNAEGEFLYMPMLEIAARLEHGDLALEEAADQARALLARQVETGDRAARIAAR